MSNYYGTYSQYLGAQRCCNLKTQGPPGPQGPTGPAAIGPPGYTGPTGQSSGFTGPTGLSYWDPSGATGISYINDVYIGGKLYVNGGIDPTYLALTPQISNPMPNGYYGIWVDATNNNALRSNEIYIGGPSNPVVISPTNIDMSGNTITNAITISTPNLSYYAPQKVEFLTGDTSTPVGPKDVNQRQVYVNATNPNSSVDIALNDPLWYLGGYYTGGITLAFDSLSIELIWNANDNSWYVIELSTAIPYN